MPKMGLHTENEQRLRADRLQVHNNRIHSNRCWQGQIKGSLEQRSQAKFFTNEASIDGDQNDKQRLDKDDGGRE